MRKQYPFDLIDSRWQRFWAERKTFRVPDFGDPDFDPKKKKLYVLDMFPYPSGAGLHVGHPLQKIGCDIVARKKRMEGWNVLFPPGWDAFGLPAEQYAIETGAHPAETTKRNIDTFRRQIQMFGFSYDWSREVSTTDPDYFKWTQWIFLQLYKKGLAYEAEVDVWWCDGCKAVLANEEVLADGTCERKGHKEVYRRPLRQWLLRITTYAERLLKDLDLLDWPNSIKEMQRNWIGRSEGATVKFQISNSCPAMAEIKSQIIEVFTTRPDTLFGATYMVLAPEHPLVDKVTTPEQRKGVEGYRADTARKSEVERAKLEKEKTGVFTGAYAINPVNDGKIPIWIADYVMMGYGTGAIMAVPAHDERDLEFARKFSLPIIEVVKPTDGGAYGNAPLQEAFSSDGIAINSGIITGLPTPEAKKKIIAWLEERKLGKATVNYKLRDWIFSRQRYWGEPIPLVHCKKCGTVPIPESDLPLRLPELKDYSPTGNAEPPLAKATEWVNTKCSQCGGEAKRETNTMPQWAGSCWYYLRFIDPKNSESFCGKEKEKYWMTVDLYVGGVEHAVLHLLYSRFWHKALHDLGHVSTPEPFMKLVNQGMILGEDSQKMSKSRGNVINPDDVVREYGADAFRAYEMFMGPLWMVKPWSMNGVEGVYRFLGRVWRLYTDEASVDAFDQKQTLASKEFEARAELLREIRLHPLIKPDAPTSQQLAILHRTIKKVSEDIDGMTFNTAISAMMIFVNEAMTWPNRPESVLKTFLLLLSPFAPHLAEELWAKFGLSDTLSYEPWPGYEPRYLEEDEIDIVIQVNGKLRDKIRVAKTWTEDLVKTKALESPRVKDFISGKTIRKVIVVPGKLVNFVIG